MELQAFTTNNLGTNGSRDAIGRVAASAEEKIYFPHAHVPILDDNLLDAYSEPDGVADFVRDLESWDPDRES
jgi:hypothetical protein